MTMILSAVAVFSVASALGNSLVYLKTKSASSLAAAIITAAVATIIYTYVI